MGMLTKFLGMLVDAGKQKSVTGGITPYRKDPIPGDAEWADAAQMLQRGLPDVQTQRSAGYFRGDIEPTFDMRGMGDQRQAISNVGDVTRKYDQDAGFLSVPGMPGEPNIRHGLEIDFPPGQGFETRIPEMLKDEYMGLTVHKGPQGANRITSQDVPEFSFEDVAALRDRIDNPIDQILHDLGARKSMRDMAKQFDEIPGLSARPTLNRTSVMHKLDEGGHMPFADPETMVNETMQDALRRNYYERTGQRR